ncbi:MAG: hypothetical protein KKH94_04270 [Candidatus Omnitrophica bacterium]|nr:hypothetical protein [Candidatus Omnitrophota bacterium]
MTHEEINFIDDFEEEGEDDVSSAWIVMFGDSMSLLLTFFVLLISFSLFSYGSVTTQMRSLSEFLGGGERRGEQTIRKSINVSKKKLEVDDDMKSVQLADASFFVKNKKKGIDDDINKFQKMNKEIAERVKEFIKENPALLSVLIQKKLADQVKTFRINSDEETDTLPLNYTQIELSLQNLGHFIQSEGLHTMTDFKRKPNGEIMIEIDCSALFQEETDTLNPESELLLMHIATILKHIPNRVTVENFEKNTSHYDITQGTKSHEWATMFSRAEKIIHFLVFSDSSIDESRFCILTKDNTKQGKGVLETNTYERSIGITILPIYN